MTTYTLSKPLKVGEQTYTSFTFREPTAGDLAVADRVEGDINKSLAIFAAMAEVPLAAIKAVPLREFNRMSAIVTPMRGESMEPAGQT